VGEDGMQILKLSKDIRTESMRVSLVRSLDSMNERLAVDSSIMSYLQFALIDQDTASLLLGRATMEEVLVEMREFQKRMSLQKRMAAQVASQQEDQQANAQNQMGNVAYNQMVQSQTRDQLNKQTDQSIKMAAVNAKRK
jgi:hypothetical protein